MDERKREAGEGRELWISPLRSWSPWATCLGKWKVVSVLGNGPYSFLNMTDHLVPVCCSPVGTSQPQHCWRCCLDNPCCRAACAWWCVYLAVSLVSTQQMPVAHPTPSGDNQTCFQTLPNIWGQSSALPFENHCSPGVHVWDKCRPEQPVHNRNWELGVGRKVREHVVVPCPPPPLQHTPPLCTWGDCDPRELVNIQKRKYKYLR